jgi:hypothetical protein
MSMTPPPSEHDQRLERVLAEFLHAVEDGSAPDRAALLRQHPDLAPDLESFFRNRDALERIAKPIKQQAPDLAETIGASDSPNGPTVRYFGDYELLEEIARGGMGVVYKARQVSLDRLVALKMILAGQLASGADIKRFRLEAEAAAQLDHPNIVPIHEIGTHEGHQYYAMQYVDGPSLARHPDRARWSNRDIAELICTCAEAVQYAHERGVVHRDLKPGNILLASVVHGPWSLVKNSNSLSLTTDDGPRTTDIFPKITDFGLAKRIGQGASLTASGQPFGTPGYMAPEQASGNKDVGPAADVYGLGATLYDLLTGRPPFRAATPLDTVMQVLAEEPVPPSQIAPKVPRDLETICLRCLDKQPDRRYPSAKALADDLGRFLNYEPIEARPAGRARRLGVWVRKRPWVVVGLAMLSVLAVALVAQAFYLENRRQRLESLYREARIVRLALAGQPAPAATGPLRPAAQRALERLRLAAAVRPEGRLYQEALDVLLVEHRGGRGVYPHPWSKAELPRAWVKPDTEFPRPFALSRDGTALLFPDRVYRMDSGTTDGPGALPAGAWPRGPEFSADGRLVARVADGAEVQVRAVDTNARVGRASAPYAGVFALSPDGTSLAWSGGFSGVGGAGVRVLRVADGELLHELRPTGPVAVIRIAYTPDGKYIIGQAGYSERDAIYNSFGRAGEDGKLTPDFAEHTDRINIWDTADGTLVAWLPGRMFADGPGPHGELAVARAVRIPADAEPEIEIDVWRLTDLLAALEREDLTRWVSFAITPSSGESDIVSWLGHVAFLPVVVAIGWLVATVGRVQQKRITIGWAHVGIGLAILLISVGTLAFVIAVAELADRGWVLKLANPDSARGWMIGLFGLVYLLLAFPVGKLAIQCYTHAAYGEAVVFFEQLQAVPEEERRRDEQRARRIARVFRRWMLACYIGMPIILVTVAYLDNSVFARIFPLLPISWHSLRSLWMWFIFTTSALLPTFVLLLLVQCILAIADARWGRAKEQWFTPPSGSVRNRWQRLVVAYVNQFPLSRGATIAHWLVVLVVALGLTAFELYTRLAAGNWPRLGAAPHEEWFDGNSTIFLALAVFYVLFGVVRLVQIATTSDRQALFTSNA